MAAAVATTPRSEVLVHADGQNRVALRVWAYEMRIDTINRTAKLEATKSRAVLCLINFFVIRGFVGLTREIAAEIRPEQAFLAVELHQIVGWKAFSSLTVGKTRVPATGGALRWLLSKALTTSVIRAMLSWVYVTSTLILATFGDLEGKISSLRPSTGPEKSGERKLCTFLGDIKKQAFLSMGYKELISPPYRALSVAECSAIERSPAGADLFPVCLLLEKLEDALRPKTSKSEEMCASKAILIAPGECGVGCTVNHLVKPIIYA
jgi:hypothetical protein